MRFPQSGPARALLGAVVVLTLTLPAVLIRAQQTESVPRATAVLATHTAAPPPNVVLALARVTARDTLWHDTLLWNNTVLWNVTAAEHAARERARLASHPRVRLTSVMVLGNGNCGGDLPPCWVMMRESRGNIRAMNPSGAAGKWQIMPGTWGHFMGYASAADAPEWVQDAKARSMALCNWQPPNYCAG